MENELLNVATQVGEQIAGGDTAEYTLTGTAAIILIIAYKLFLFIGKRIPDDKKGFLGFVRKVCKFVTLYQPNVTSSK